MDLEFDVSNMVVKRTDQCKIADYSNEYLRLVFTFKSSDWNGLSKFVLFKGVDGVYKVPCANGTVIVPHEVLTDDYFQFSLYGSGTGNVRVTTNEYKVPLAESGYTEDTLNPIPDTELDLVEDIYNRLDNTREMEVTYGDGSEETLLLVVKDDTV